MGRSLRVLVSGGTGFLGRALTPILRHEADVTLISRGDAGHLKADLTLWDGGLDPASLKGRFDVFLHLAGLYDLRVPRVEAHRHNVNGTHTALTIAQKAEIPRFIHASTVAVAFGTQTRGLVRTDQLDHHASFPDHYAATKAAAEMMVRSWAGSQPASRLILRLGILVGSTDGSPIQRIDGPYHAAEGLKRLLRLADAIPGPLPLPGRDGVSIPIVPVDSAASAIAKLLTLSHQQSWSGVRTLHLTPHTGLAARELYESTLRHLGRGDRRITLLSRLPDWLAKSAAESVAKFPSEELSYLLRFPRYDVSETEAILGTNWCPEFAAYEDAFWRGYDAYVSNR